MRASLFRRLISCFFSSSMRARVNDRKVLIFINRYGNTLATGARNNDEMKPAMTLSATFAGSVQHNSNNSSTGTFA
jgi:hypothetical protein